jgi:hypothetical protein
MIRPAKFEDFNQVYPLFEKVFAQSPFAGRLELQRLHIQRMFAGGCVMPAFFCEVVEHDDEIVGFMAGIVQENIWGVKMATDLFVYSEKDTHKLLRKFRTWAKEQGAEAISITNISGEPRYSELVERLGATPIGETFLEIF